MKRNKDINYIKNKFKDLNFNIDKKLLKTLNSFNNISTFRNLQLLSPKIIILVTT